MKKFSLAVVSVQAFRQKGGEQVMDKNTKGAVILIAVAGAIPNRNVIAGTVAEQSGFVVGKSYLVRIQETAPSEEYGRQFRFTPIQEADFSAIMQAQKSVSEGGLGDGVVVDVVTSNDVEAETTTGGETGGTKIGTSGRKPAAGRK